MKHKITNTLHSRETLLTFEKVGWMEVMPVFFTMPDVGVQNIGTTKKDTYISHAKV